MEATLAIQEFIEYVVAQLIDHPEAASVLHDLNGHRHEFRVRLHPDDIGRVIGPQRGDHQCHSQSGDGGRTIKNDLKISVEIEESD